MHYSGQKIAFLTQHGKDHLLQPLFSDLLGCEIVRAEGFDTDQIGTFTRDIERQGTQFAAARFKAKKAIELTGLAVGMGSEGAFGGDPAGGLMPWNLEVLVWVDSHRQVEIVGVAQGPGGGLQRSLTSESELRQFAHDADFPGHGVILRPDSHDDPRIYKESINWRLLKETFYAALEESSQGRVVAEVDLRAHRNPTRQKMILRAAENLILKIRSACTECGTPGFWEKAKVPGLPCGLCRQPTRMPKTFIWQCDSCEYTEEKSVPADEYADPSRCDYCNP